MLLVLMMRMMTPLLLLPLLLMTAKMSERKNLRVRTRGTTMMIVMTATLNPARTMPTWVWDD